jgi:hypothetical protein
MFEALKPKNEIISKMQYFVQKNGKKYWAEAIIHKEKQSFIKLRADRLE